MNLYTIIEQNNTLYYTSARQTRELDGITYEPTEINRSRYRHDVLGKKTDLSITTPERGILRKYLTPFFSQVRLVIALMDGTVFWRGKLVSISVRGGSVREIIAVFVSRKLNSTIHERRVVQRTCPYELYGRNCKATTPAVSMPAIAITGDRELVVDNAGGEIPDDDLIKYRGGLLLYNDLKWWITRVTKDLTGMNQLKLYTFHNLDNQIPAGGMTPPSVKIRKGCNRTINDCQDIHDNIARFGAWNFSYTSPFGDAISGA